jgi:hypothetical protein
MTGKRLTVLVIVLAVVGVVFAYQQVAKPRQPAAGPPVDLVVEPERRGNPEAPIKVEAYYPLNEGHKFIAEYLLEFAEAHPEQVSVVVYDLQSTNGRKQWGTSGLDCAGVLINGKTRHQIGSGEESRRVDFIQRMGTLWTEGDFEALVAQLSAEEGKTADSG